MYEDFHGLNRRPFSATPDADFTVETPAVADVIERMDRCIRQGRGIAVLTALSGFGKTHVCQKLAQLWLPEFQVAMLPNAGFPSGRGLLQAILAELEQPYQRLKETELRIELKAVARDVRQKSSGLILILDESHRYSERLLEEIRLIANLVDAGEPLIRIVLAGKTELEDILSEPGQSGLNERIGELVSLSRLTAEESRQYLNDRAVHAGGTIESLFDPDAVDLTVRACGGVPRCLNQLADHALLLGFVAERRPVNASLIRDALDDLKRLPLQWQDPSPVTRRASNQTVSGCGSTDIETIIEIGGLQEETFETDCGPFEPARDDTSKEPPSVPVGMSSDVFEGDDACDGRTSALLAPATETICDRFAQIDAGIARQRWFDELERGGSDRRGAGGDVSPEMPSEIRLAANPLELLDQIEPLIGEEIDAMSPQRAADALPDSTTRFHAAPRAERPVSNQERPEFRLADRAGQRAGEVRHATLFRDLRRGDRSRGGDGL